MKKLYILSIIVALIVFAVSATVGYSQEGYPAPIDSGYPAPIDNGYPAPPIDSGYPAPIASSPNVLEYFKGMLSSFASSINSNGQETCPSDDIEWIKFDGLSGMEFNAGAPEGKLITEWCYKAATYVVYGEVLPPTQSVLITSTVGHELSHVSIKIIDLYYTPTNTPFTPPTNTPTYTSTPSDESTPTNTPEVTNTPSLSKTPDPTSTPTRVNTLPPPKESTPQLLPQTGGENLRLHNMFWLIVGMLGLGLIIIKRNE